jgi:hypothetical protein
VGSAGGRSKQWAGDLARLARAPALASPLLPTSTASYRTLGTESLLTRSLAREGEGRLAGLQAELRNYKVKWPPPGAALTAKQRRQYITKGIYC